jgi:plasmid stabilization system protein ParE
MPAVFFSQRALSDLERVFDFLARELVISKGRTGYVALYRYLPEQDRVDILAIRHQRESGLVE